MLILVVSDSHGRSDAMLSLVAVRQPDLFIHLGDNQRDVQAIAREWPELPILSVPGNCDFSRESSVITYSCGRVTLYAVHGHQYGVKSGTERLVGAARAAGAHIALFGHTHMSHNEDVGGLLLFNPGSISLPRVGSPTYGLIEIDGEKMAAQIVPYLRT